MKFIEFENCLFELTGLVISKHDYPMTDDHQSESFTLSVQGRIMSRHVTYNNREERDQAYESLKNKLAEYKLLLG